MLLSFTPRLFLPTLSLLILAHLSGCTHPASGIRPGDRRVFQAFERAADRAEHRVADSLVAFRVESSGSSQRDRNRGSVSFTGVVLTAEGHLLAPFTIRPDTDSRIEAWIGDQRYLARPLKAEDSIGMTILKIEPREPLTPLNLSRVVDLKAGEHGILVIPSHEEQEFERFTFLAFCQGIVEGRYRQFSLSPQPSATRGAPLLNTSGELVGLMSQNTAWSLSDLRLDLDVLLDEVTGRAADRTAHDENAWFGATLSPINLDYARKNNLPRSALWLLHVFEDSPAYQAGFRSGDLLVELNGEPLRLSGSRAYQYFLQALRPRVGAPFTVKALRDGKEILGSGHMAQRPEPRTLRAEDLGITASELDETLLVRHNLYIDHGVLITDVDPGSPAATGRRMGRNLLMPRDVITSLGGHPTPTLADFGVALDRIRRERPPVVLVEFQRGPVTGFEALNLRIGERDTGVSP